MKLLALSLIIGGFLYLSLTAVMAVWLLAIAVKGTFGALRRLF